MSDSDDALIDALSTIGKADTLVGMRCGQAAARLAELLDRATAAEARSANQAATIESMLAETVEWECEIAAAEAREAKLREALRKIEEETSAIGGWHVQDAHRYARAALAESETPEQRSARVQASLDRKLAERLTPYAAPDSADNDWGEGNDR
jgi:aspartate/methionine/tyrosine aminotransferase